VETEPDGELLPLVPYRREENEPADDSHGPADGGRDDDGDELGLLVSR
jgi:hypothetical protein